MQRLSDSGVCDNCILRLVCAEEGKTITATFIFDQAVEIKLVRIEIGGGGGVWLAF